MRRALLLPLLALLVLVAPAAAQAKAGGASARLTECDVAARTADFAADMRAVPGATRMQLRFSLQVQDGRSWERVAAPTFDTWMTATPGRTRWVYEKHVENLQPGAYRVVVRFRWRDEAGTTVRTAVKRSKACRVPDPRPDLVALSIQTLPSAAAADLRRYVVVVANQGNGAAGAFELALTVDGVPLPEQTVDGLDAGRRTRVTFEGPVCAPGGTLVAGVDASGLVDEAREADDTLTVPC